MIYVQLSSRAKLEMGQTLHIRDIARIIGPKAADQLPLPCPKEQGIWKLTALHVTQALQRAYPQESLTLMGADICYVHR